jgi:hypothetical protein
LTLAALASREPPDLTTHQPSGRTQPVAVAAAELVGGKYCEDCHVAEIVKEQNVRGGVRPYALDPARAKGLWAKSEEMVGERF